MTAYFLYKKVVFFKQNISKSGKTKKEIGFLVEIKQDKMHNLYNILERRRSNGAKKIAG